MDRKIDDNAVLKLVKFQILPNLNRYRAFAGDGHKDELLIEGLLEQLTQHLPQIKDFYVDCSVKLQWPRSSCPGAWFTKSTFRRFLSIAANSTKILNEIKAIEDETSQLETTRKFHLSLYSQSESKAEGVSSDPSKNELLRAMDSRLRALREELTASLEQAAGSFCSTKDISHMVNCCHSLGAMALKKYLIKYSELNQITLFLDNPSVERPTFLNAGECDDETVTVADGAVSTLSRSVVHVQYGVSPVKAAKAERDSTSHNEDSSDEIVVDATERSRSVTRSATPRRSASPMRRVQIARVGSRRAPAIGIRSLNNLPIRERTLNSVDDELSNNSDEEVSEKMSRKIETNEQRISVQAAISLFENKQREDNTDIRKKSLGDGPKNVKPVLRKWNSCVEQSHVLRSSETVTENHSFSTAANPQDVETHKIDRQEPDTVNVDVTHQAGELDAALLTRNSLESSAPNTTGGNTTDALGKDSTERLTASAKWNQQKEAELNMLMKMIEDKPTKQRRSIADKNNSSEQKGGFSDDYKKKRDEKLRGEVPEKQAEKESHFKAMQQIIENSNGDKPSKPGRHRSLDKPISSIAPQQSGISKDKSQKDTKSAIVKRTSKSSSVPATRKSWPSSPPLQATGTSPMAVSSSKVAPSTVTAKDVKSQPLQLLARPYPKLEKTLPQKNAKELKTKSKTSSKGAVVVHQQPWARDTKPTKPKSLACFEDFSEMAPVKTELPTKGAKRNSVTPVESKPFLRKGSKVGPAVAPAGTKSKSSPILKETVRKSGNTLGSQGKEMVVQSPAQVDKHEIKYIFNDQVAPDLVSEIPVRSEQKIMDPQTSPKDSADGSANLAVVEDHSIAFDKEETTIPPSAWVEEECQDPPIMPIPIDDNEVQFAYPTSFTSVETKSPRMRQSLSKMLQEETNELESTEWGNAEHPSVICSKDAPKGFKRLLKFARKSKGDANSSGWSSPSVFSEGDEDADDHKAAFQRTLDKQLRKANYQTKSTGQLKPLGKGPDRKYSSGNQTHETSNGASISSYHAGEGHNSGVSGTKSSRSFFSLSAFRGSSKANHKYKPPRLIL